MSLGDEISDSKGPTSRPTIGNETSAAAGAVPFSPPWSTGPHYAAGNEHHIRGDRCSRSLARGE